jgi:tetratricopeptide (TPR) repeat protein
MNKKIKVFIYIIINLPKLIIAGKLFSKQKYNEIIEISKKWLDKKNDDFFARRNIAIAYAYIGKSDEGFEYVKELIQKTKSDTFIEKMLRYFIYPEFKSKNYDKIIYRCSYFNNDEMSEYSKNKINKIIFTARGSHTVPDTIL